MPSPLNAAFMQRAIELAVQAVESKSGGPFGAVVVKDGQIVGEGQNRVTSTNDPTAHAEVEALRAAGGALGTFDLTGCELYTSCEPCPMCLAAALWSRIDSIAFAGTRDDAAAAGFDDKAFYVELALPEAERRVPMTPFLHADAARAFAAWQAQVDRSPY
jgi:guanine deaminase